MYGEKIPAKARASVKVRKNFYGSTTQLANGSVCFGERETRWQWELERSKEEPDGYSQVSRSSASGELRLGSATDEPAVKVRSGIGLPNRAPSEERGSVLAWPWRRFSLTYYCVLSWCCCSNNASRDAHWHSRRWRYLRDYTFILLRFSKKYFHYNILWKKFYF